MRRIWKFLAQSNIIQQIQFVSEKRSCLILSSFTSPSSPATVFASVKMPENTWGILKYGSNTIPFLLTPKCPGHTAVNSEGSWDPRSNLPVQHGQYRLTGLWLPLEPALFLLSCCFAPYFPSWKTGSSFKVNQVTKKTNYNTMEDEETHDRIFNTERDGTIFLCRVTSAALFLRELDAGSGLGLPAQKH